MSALPNQIVDPSILIKNLLLLFLDDHISYFQFDVKFLIWSFELGIIQVS